MNKDKKQLSAKIVIIGDIGVGKSSITIRYVFDKFDINQQSTLGAAYMQKICTFHYAVGGGPEQIRKNSKQSKQQKQQLNNNNYQHSRQGTYGTLGQYKGDQHNLKLQIWDTAGQEKYKAIAKLYYRDCRVAILVYDITKQDTFDNLKKWHQQLLKHAPKNIKLVIIGNKIDLLELIIDQKPVPYKMGQEYAKQIGALFAEVSAKNKKGIDQIFGAIAELIGPIVYRQKKLKKQSLSKSILEDSDDQKSKNKCCKS